MYEEQRVRSLSQGPGGFSKALLTPPAALKHQYKGIICSLGVRSSVWGWRGAGTHGRSGRMKMDFSPPIFSLRRSRSPLPFTPTTWRPTGDWAGAVHHGIGSGPGPGFGSGMCGEGRRLWNRLPGCHANPGPVWTWETRRQHYRCAREWPPARGARAVPSRAAAGSRRSPASPHRSARGDRFPAQHRTKLGTRCQGSDLSRGATRLRALPISPPDCNGLQD